MSLPNSGLNGVPHPRYSKARFTESVSMPFGAVNTGAYVWDTVVFSYGEDITPVIDTDLGSYFQINKDGLYSITLAIRVDGSTGTWAMKNKPSPASTAPLGSNENLIFYNFNSGTFGGSSTVAFLRAGDRIFSGNDAGSVNNGLCYFECTRIGNPS